MRQGIKALSILLMLAFYGESQVPSIVVRLEAEEPDHVIWHTPRWRAPGQRRIAVSLRGGAAKGLAHIGVLQRFEEEGIPVDAMTGTSAGSFVATLAATGFSGTNQVLLFQRMNFSALLDDRRRSTGHTLAEEEDSNANFMSFSLNGKQADMITGKERTLRVQKILYSILGTSFLTFGEDFDHMRIPIRIVATDLTTGDPWVFRKGPLAEAVQASMTIPGLLVPLEIEGHQLVDGGLVENLPIVISRKEFPGMVQVGVDISKKWDGSHVRGVVALLNRSLDVSMRQNEERSKDAADLLISPNTDGVDDFDFHDQVEVLVASGRSAFDDKLSQLESKIYGPDGERIATRLPLGLESSNPPGVLKLVQRSLPSAGPIRFKDIYRLLRRLHRQLPLADAWVEVPTDPALPSRLHTVTQPLVRRIEIKLPQWLSPEESNLFRGRMAVQGLLPGEPYSPAALDAGLAEFPLYAAIPHTSYLRFTDSTFDPATGVLTFRGEGVRLEKFEVFPEFWKAPFDRLFRDLVGQPLQPGELLQRIDLARRRFGITRFGSATGTAGVTKGLRLKLFPERETSVVVSLAPAYGNTWGAHLGFGVEARNPFGAPVNLAADGAVNDLQKRGALRLNQEVSWLPGFGYTTYSNFSRQRFGNDLLLVEGPQSALKDLTIRHQSVGVGLWIRFGGDDHGMARLSMEERRSSFTTSAYDSSRGVERTVQASAEWDNLDFNALPREGSRPWWKVI